MEDEMMMLRCVDNTSCNRELGLGRTYLIDPSRQTETNLYGAATHYFVNGKRYGTWRFEPVEDTNTPVFDPTPQPLGCPADAARLGESGEQRAFRRFPIGRKI